MPLEDLPYFERMEEVQERYMPKVDGSITQWAMYAGKLEDYSLDASERPEHSAKLCTLLSMIDSNHPWLSCPSHYEAKSGGIGCFTFVNETTEDVHEVEVQNGKIVTIRVEYNAPTEEIINALLKRPYFDNPQYQ